MSAIQRNLTVCLAATLAWTMVPAELVGAPKEDNGKVTHVTLYRGQALVTREISLSAEDKDLELLVGDLPQNIVPGSLFAEGEKTVQVRAVRFRTRAVGEEPRDEVRKIDLAMEEINDKIQLNKQMEQLLGKRTQYLDKLEGFVAPTANAELSKGVLNAEALERLTKFSFDQRQAVVTEQMKLLKEQKKLQNELSLLARRKAEITNGSTKSVREAVLFLEKKAGAATKVRLNYLVSGCGWSPTYTIRAGENRKNVAVEYNALIYQLSGEDWSSVTLTLSTASPRLSAAGPDLAPFQVTLSADANKKHDPSSLTKQFQSFRGRQKLAIEQGQQALNLSDVIGNSWEANAAANDVQNLELVGGKDVLRAMRDVDASMGRGISLSYELDGTVSLASRSDQQMVRILETGFQSEFYHVATPVLTNFVYREAKLANSSDHDLLAGAVSVYLDGRFVGRSEIPTVARGQEFIVGFGADPQIRARRELVEKKESVQGGNRELVFHYRLSAENFKKEPVTVRLLDRLPHSPHDSDVRVTLSDMTHELSEDKLYVRQARPKGLLRWEVEVPAEASGEEARLVEYHYTVEFDRNFQLAAPSATPQQQKEFEQQYREKLLQ